MRKPPPQPNPRATSHFQLSLDYIIKSFYVRVHHYGAVQNTTCMPSLCPPHLPPLPHLFPPSPLFLSLPLLLHVGTRMDSLTHVSGGASFSPMSLTLTNYCVCICTFAAAATHVTLRPLRMVEVCRSSRAFVPVLCRARGWFLHVTTDTAGD